MTQHIGIVAGSAEGATCYRTICLEAPAIMGENHPEITMNSMPMAEHMVHTANAREPQPLENTNE